MKRMLSWILCVLMASSLMPAVAFAEKRDAQEPPKEGDGDQI